MKAKVIFTTLATIVLGCSGIYGQNQVAGAINPESTTRKIVTIPQLQPPKEVIESGLGGNVRVSVTVDDEGNVTSVDDVAGPGAVCRQVTRADVAAMRNSAKEAAMTAKFEPSSHLSGAFKTWLNFTFPGGEEESDFAASPAETVSDGAKYTVKGDTNFSSSAAPGAADTKSEIKSDGVRYTVKGDVNSGSSDAQGTTGSANTKSEIPPEPSGPRPANIPKRISGGVLNGKAYELPKPPYPPAARAVRATGAVSVQVLIDEKGEVFLAKAISGHPLLRSASVIAACDSRFAPTRLAGYPVKVSGMVTYNFVP